MNVLSFGTIDCSSHLCITLKPYTEIVLQCFYVLTCLSRYTGCLSMDVIASTAFGLELNSQEDHEHPFVVHAKKAFKFTLNSLIMFIASKSSRAFSASCIHYFAFDTFDD